MTRGLASARLLGISFLARLPAALCPTGTLILVTDLEGIGRAGVLAGVLWLGQAIGGQTIGRLADRRGHRTVLLVASILNAAAIVGLIGTVLGGAPVVGQAVFAAAVGVTVPQVGPLSRTRWVAMAKGRDGGAEIISRAMSFDTTMDEASFFAGPALAGAVGVLIHPAGALGLAAVLMVVFGVLFAVDPSAPKGVGAVRAAGVPLLSSGLMVLFVLTVLQGGIWGAANAGVNALAKDLGDQGIAGFIWAGMAVTSSIAGLVVTARPSRRDLTVRAALAVVAEAVLIVPLLAVEGFAGAAVVIAGIGVAVAPYLITLFSLGERVAPAERMGEAMGLLGSGLILGEAISAPIAGTLAQRFGFASAFGISCAAGLLAAVVTVGLVRGRRFAVDPVVVESSPVATGGGLPGPERSVASGSPER
ncbi:MFS transporter [Nocardia sp. NPDC052566]|uniref:MFS transporter n=1 Tax=Nocardia sp. NPDC052566 TaxID=3364330 RepID=UPI0037CAC602